MFCLPTGLVIFLVALQARRTVFRDEANRRERRLAREFREIVREPLPDPSDPRFKKWDVRGRFPWGKEFLQRQPYERLARRQSH